MESSELMESSEMEGERLARDVQSRLDAHAHASTRDWFEEQGLGRWRGCEQVAVRARTLEAERDNRPSDPNDGGAWSEARYHACLSLMRSEFADDKLSGMTLFQELVLPDPSVHARLFGEDTSSDDDDDDDDDAGPLSASTHSKPNGDGNKQITPFLAQILQLFDDPSAAGVNDWSTSDGISFKVLGPYVAAHPHPRRAARYLLAWATRAAPGTRAARSFSHHHHSKGVSSSIVNPYSRRAGLVAFLNYVDDKDACAFNSSDPTAVAQVPTRERRGGEGLFGTGFVAELAVACGDVLGLIDADRPTSSAVLRSRVERDSSNWDSSVHPGTSPWEDEGSDDVRVANELMGGSPPSCKAEDETPIDPSLSPIGADAWACDGAWAVLGLCARESARADRATIAAERSGGANRRAFTIQSASEVNVDRHPAKRAKTESRS